MFFEFINIVIFAVLLYLGYLLFFNPKENFSACGCTDNINENNEKTKLVNDHLTFVFQRQIGAESEKMLKKIWRALSRKLAEDKNTNQYQSRMHINKFLQSNAPLLTFTYQNNEIGVPIEWYKRKNNRKFQRELAKLMSSIILENASAEDIVSFEGAITKPTRKDVLSGRDNISTLLNNYDIKVKDIQVLKKRKNMSFKGVHPKRVEQLTCPYFNDDAEKERINTDPLFSDFHEGKTSKLSEPKENKIIYDQNGRKRVLPGGSYNLFCDNEDTELTCKIKDKQGVYVDTKGKDRTGCFYSQNLTTEQKSKKAKDIKCISPQMRRYVSDELGNFFPYPFNEYIKLNPSELRMYKNKNKDYCFAEIDYGKTIPIDFEIDQQNVNQKGTIKWESRLKNKIENANNKLSEECKKYTKNKYGTISEQRFQINRNNTAYCEGLQKFNDLEDTVLPVQYSIDAKKINLQSQNKINELLKYTCKQHGATYYAARNICTAKSLGQTIEKNLKGEITNRSKQKLNKIREKKCDLIFPPIITREEEESPKCSRKLGYGDFTYNLTDSAETVIDKANNILKEQCVYEFEKKYPGGKFESIIPNINKNSCSANVNSQIETINF